MTKREVIIFSLYKQFILNNSKCESVRRDRHCRWWQQKVFFFSKFWLLYLFCLIANATDKLNFLKRLLAIPEIPTWLCCFLPVPPILYMSYTSFIPYLWSSFWCSSLHFIAWIEYVGDFETIVFSQMPTATC